MDGLRDGLASLGLPERVLVLLQRGEEGGRAGEEPLLQGLQHELGGQLLGVVLEPASTAVRRTARGPRGSPFSSSVYGTSSGSSIRLGNRGEPSHLGGNSDFMRRHHDRIQLLAVGRRCCGRTAGCRAVRAGPRSSPGSRCAAWPSGRACARSAGPGAGAPRCGASRWRTCPARTGRSCGPRPRSAGRTCGGRSARPGRAGSPGTAAAVALA